MSDENFTGVRATTADEEAVMFRQSWIKAERENAALRAENARLREEVESLKSEESCNDVLLEYAQAESQRLREENARLREALEGLQEIIARKYDIMQDVEVQK